MIGFYNYTVVLTYLGLASAFSGILVILSGADPIWSIMCLMFSGFCDMFDGKVARTKKRTEQEKKFGIQIDSLADLVCFGVLPAVIGYGLGLREVHHAVILIIFVLAALIRLAYFNVMEEERQQTTNEVRKVYEGLPVTSVSLLLPFVYIFKPIANDKFYLVYGAALFIIALAFVSKLKIKKPELAMMIVFLIIGIAEIVWLKLNL